MKSIFEMLKIAAVEDDFIFNSSMQRFSVWETKGADCYFFSPDLQRANSFFMREAREAQLRKMGGIFALSPMVDVCRTPSFNRLEESYGEDGYLSAL